MLSNDAHITFIYNYVYCSMISNILIMDDIFPYISPLE